MPYSAQAVANYFIDLALAEGQKLTPMKVQKLVYYAHGWHLAILNSPLLNEQVEAWKFGPVIRSLYTDLATYGNQSIPEKIKSYSFDKDTRRFRAFIPEIPANDVNTLAVRTLLNRIWQIFGKYTAVQLSNMTHAQGTPWDQINRKYNGKLPKGTDIPAELIQQHFSELRKK